MVEDLNGILCLLEDRHCGLLLHLSTMASNQRTKASQFKLLKVKQVSGVNLKYVLGGKIVTISSQLSLLLLFPIFCFLPFLRRVLLVVLLSLFFHPSLKKLECGWWATFVMKTQKHGQSSLSDFGLYFLSFIFFFIFFFFNIDCRSGGEEIRDWVVSFQQPTISPGIEIGGWRLVQLMDPF